MATNMGLALLSGEKRLTASVLALKTKSPHRWRWRRPRFTPSLPAQMRAKVPTPKAQQ